MLQFMESWPLYVSALVRIPLNVPFLMNVNLGIDFILRSSVSWCSWGSSESKGM